MAFYRMADSKMENINIPVTKATHHPHTQKRIHIFLLSHYSERNLSTVSLCNKSLCSKGKPTSLLRDYVWPVAFTAGKVDAQKF